jgi:hypothetical protein
MATLRDGLLPLVDGLRQIPGNFGLRRYAVTLRRRVWSGSAIGQGTPQDQDLLLQPAPKVRDAFSVKPNDGDWARLQYILQHGHTIADRMWVINRITPQFLDELGFPKGGWTPAQLRMEPPPDAKNVECIVVIIGDDGVRRECGQISLDLDRAFGYTMFVQETDRPTVALQSIDLDLQPVGATQMIANGTFEDGSISLITPLCIWTSDNLAIATIDVLGNLTPVSSGTANITASMGSVTSDSFAYVVP